VLFRSWEGFVSGILYALIALGFVLIFKASGVFNFAQGIMVVFGALSLVGLYFLLEKYGPFASGVHAYIALLLCIAIMYLLAFSVERVVLRPLVNQSEIILFMATIGLNYFLIGLGEFVFGGEPKFLEQLSTQERHELPLIVSAIHDDPNNEVQRDRLFRDCVMHLANATLTEIPRAVMCWPGSANVEECEALLAEIEDFSAMSMLQGTYEEYGSQIASWRYYATCYRDYLLDRGDYEDFEEYLNASSEKQK